MKEFYTINLYTHNLDFTINILFALLPIINLSIPLLSINPSYFLMHFKVSCRNQYTFPKLYIYIHTYIYIFKFFLAAPHGLWDLSSLTRD